MIANFFNKTKPVNVLNVIVLLLIFFVASIVIRKTEAITLLFLVERTWFFLRLLVIVLLINFILKKNNLTQDNSYASLMVVLLLGTFPETMFASTIIYSTIFLILAFRKIYSLRSAIHTESKLFDAGFWVGIALLFYLWSALYIVLIYIAMLIYQKLSVKNLFIPIIGVVTPVVLYFTYLFYFDQQAVFYSKFNFLSNLNFTSYNSIKLLVPLTLLLITLVWSVFSVTPKVVLISNKLKLSWNVLLNQLIISLIIVLLAPVKNGSELFFLIFPSAIIIANFLQKIESSNFKNLILYLFLIVSISVYFL